MKRKESKMMVPKPARPTRIQSLSDTQKVPDIKLPGEKSHKPKGKK